MSKTQRTLLITAAVLTSVLLVLVLAWRGFTHRAHPTTRGTVTVAGDLGGEVAIFRDEYGVAHIYADTPTDLYFAQGYVHAQERFWQMEFQRRTGAGRLSEIFGEATFTTDRYLRQFGFEDLASQAYADFDPEMQQVLQAYADGVNAYIGDRPPAELGLEFALLNLQGVTWEIEPWEPVDSLLWGQMMVFDQASIASAEFSKLARMHRVGTEMVDDLYPDYRPDRPVIIPDEELGYVTEQPTAYHAFTDEEIAQLTTIGGALADTYEALADVGLGLNGGSNSWVVSGEMTESGLPLLANDPHMSVNMPSLWYEMALHCNNKSPECMQQLRGFSLPGVPGFLIGHNDRIAWGLTNAGFDAEDVYIERINPQNPDQYEVNGEWVDMTIRYEEIVVRGEAEPRVVEVRSTRNGVVASDVMRRDEQGVTWEGDTLQPLAVSFQWTALEPIRSVQAIYKLNLAQNWDEFRAALSEFDAGKQTFVYADIDGNIGIQVPGKVPIRAAGDGTLPMPGWNDDYQWTGYIPYDDMPRAFNPEQGFIATANNQPVSDAYPYLFSNDPDRGQRAERITTLIEATEPPFTLDDVVRIQTDNYSIPAEEVIPYLEPLTFDDPAVAAARDSLLSWDRQMVMESPDAALFNLFWVELIEQGFHDQLPYSDGDMSGKSRDADVVALLLQEPTDSWWDDALTPNEVETRDTILAAAFETAYANGVEQMGDDYARWEWGDLHQIMWRNPTLGDSGIAFIENIFNRGPLPVHGSESVINKTCWSVPADDFDTTCMPALRRIIDMSDLDASLRVHAPGQSGHPFHPHYDDFIDMWRLFDYHPANWSRSQVEASSGADLLVLTPAGQ